MIRAFFASKKWFIWAYGGGIFILASLYGQVYVAVLVNEWYRSFFDMLQRPGEHTMDDFWKSVMYWALITGPFWILAAVTNYVMRLYTLSWREAITFNYLPRWKNVTEDIEGASQRIQEDTFRFTRILETLGVQIAQAVMMLIAFIPVLWNLSREIDVGWVKNIPGLLVWASLLVSIGGLCISWIVGIKLPKLEYDNQKAEAAFRKQLVLAEDNKIHYAATYALLELFTNIRLNYRRLFLHHGYFDLWINLYDQFVSITPYLVMGPGVFLGVSTLGMLQQVVHAFEKVYTSLSLFLHNWTVITEFRSIRLRLREFEEHLEKQQNTKGGSDLNNVIQFPVEAAMRKNAPQDLGCTETFVTEQSRGHAQTIQQALPIARRRNRTIKNLHQVESAIEGFMQVQETVGGAKAAVDEMLERITGMVHKPVERVQPAADLLEHVRQDLWLLMGGAILTGYLLDRLACESASSR